MKKITSCIAVIIAVIMSAAVNVLAAEETYITQYYSNKEHITVYTSGELSEQVAVRIAGISCEAENIGDVYHNAEKYETIFLIDSSKSMQSFSDEINAFLMECIDKKRDNEYYSIGIFASGNMPEYVAANENNQYTLEKCLDNITYEFDSTYIYDNLMNTIRNLYSDDDPVYRRIVLFTDGNENSARGITIDDVIEEIDNNPVPIYTVTLQTSTKNNIENLKNIARLSRKSNAEDIRISDGGDAVKPASILADSAQNVDCITIIPDPSLLDGSVKAVEISDGSVTITSDIRLVMTDSDYTETEITEETVTETSETEDVLTEIEPENKPEKIRLIIAVAAAVVAVICIVIIIIFIVKRKRGSLEENEPVTLANNDDTMIISGRSGQTEILINDERNDVFRSVILRDIADSIRTFEVQLSAEGAVIGRSSDFSNIVIDYDKSISRKHCRIFLKNGQVYIEDLSSGNKTFLNNNEVSSPTVINNADEIKIGRTKLKVTIK